MRSTPDKNREMMAVDNEAFDPMAENGSLPHKPGLATVEIKSGKDGDDPEEKKEKAEPVKMVGVMEMFRFAEPRDYAAMAVGTLCAMGHGVAFPLMILFFGQMIDVFADFGLLANLLATLNYTELGFTRQQVEADFTLLQPVLVANNITLDLAKFQSGMLEQMTHFALVFCGLGGGVLVVSYGQVAAWLTAAERQIWRIRLAFFAAVMRQDIGWFDTHEPGQINTRLSADMLKVKEGISDKLGNFFQWFAGFIGGVALGFAFGWKLAAVILAISPLLVIAAGLMSKIATSLTSMELKAYSKAGAVATEVLSSIRTVAAFGGEKKESERYNSNLASAKAYGVSKGITVGLSLAFTWLIVFLAYALGFWYGAKLAADPAEGYSGGRVIIVFFSIVIGAFSLGNAMPNLQAFSEGRGAAHFIFGVIGRVPPIDSYSEEGLKPASLTGNLDLKNVHFCYPSRKEVQVMDNVSLSVPSGMTVALVGPSGCGKSTTVQLIQRFYDTDEGQVMLDGTDIKQLNVGWLRQHIGVVSQEPVLFDTTIAENIRFGKEGVSLDEIKASCREANVHDFISSLPQGYETLVGERGAQLSGGQKQRIAIARALVRDPRILLLDEATSALDTESERVVQAALDKVRKGRTTVIVAHRLSTIQTADRIVALKDGRVHEEGTHSELMAKKGLYHSLVTTQMNEPQKVGKVGDDEPVEDSVLARSLSIRSGTDSMAKKSIVKGAVIDEEAEELETKEKDPGMGRVLKLNMPELPFIIIGCLASIINGGVQPAFAIIFAEFIGVFGETNAAAREDKVALIAIIFVAIGVVSFVSMFTQAGAFAKSGEGLTERVRQLAFKAMLRQEIAYFDDPKNNTGALTSRLATEASAIQGASGARLGGFLQAVANMGTSLIIAFVFGWQLTLVILAFVPFIAVGGFVEMKILAGVANRDKEAVEEASKVATEGISNIRTVVQLVREKTFHRLYEESLRQPHRTSYRQAHIIGAVFGVTQCLIYLVHGGAFYFGALFIDKGFMTFIDVFRVFAAIVFGAMALGQASSFAPDYAKAKIASINLFKLLERQTAIDSSAEDGSKPASCVGTVEFKDVRFRYPTRPDLTILRGLSLSASSGETVALVGSSGCGKSTTVQLVQRFYDIESGQVLIDGVESNTLNIQWLRAQMGVVSQEPILFDLSIRENIAYGANERQVSMQEVMDAARMANIHDFIVSLPLGYETNVGDKGTQLSGGQKQRIAIARALVRDPRILLLDEATSALDTESEKVVQEALDKAQQGRTCLVIAHRLSTVRNANNILVFDHGAVKEQGTHQELMSKQGMYYKLAQQGLKE